MTVNNVFRAHVCLHQHNCPLKALQCKVRGCKQIKHRKDMGAHVYDAARSHHDLQHGEIQRLLDLIQRKVSISTDIDKKIQWNPVNTDTKGTYRIVRNIRVSRRLSNEKE